MNQSDREKAEKTASLFFRQSDERPFKDSGLKWEDDRKILVYEISEALASERRRVLSDSRLKGLLECVESLQHEDRLPATAEMAKQIISDFQELLKEASNE